MSGIDQILEAMNNAGNRPQTRPLPIGQKYSTIDNNDDGVLDFLTEESNDYADNQGWGGNQYQAPMTNMQQQILDRQPGRNNRGPAMGEGFQTSEDMYRQFKQFILGPVSIDPNFDFDELLDILADMTDMTELVQSQRSRKRKVDRFTKGNKYLKGVDERVYDELEDMDDLSYE
jgi:hypothetical protein